MAKQKKEETSIVIARKGNNEREFPRATWDLMGPTKQGWEEVKSAPRELTKDPDADKQKNTGGAANQLTAAQQKKDDDDDAEQARKDASHAHKEVFGKYASRDLTTEEILNLISAKKAEDQQAADLKTQQEADALAEANKSQDPNAGLTPEEIAAKNLNP